MVFSAVVAETCCLFHASLPPCFAVPYAAFPAQLAPLYVTVRSRTSMPRMRPPFVNSHCSIAPMPVAQVDTLPTQ